MPFSGLGDNGGAVGGSVASGGTVVMYVGTTLRANLFAVAAANGAFTLELQITHNGGSNWVSAKTAVSAAPSAGGDATYTNQAALDTLLPTNSRLVLSNKKGSTLTYRYDYTIVSFAGTY